MTIYLRPALLPGALTPLPLGAFLPACGQGARLMAFFKALRVLVPRARAQIA